MLTPNEAITYLLRHRLIDPSCVVAGDLTVVHISRRNHSFKVTSQQGLSYLLKQGLGPDGGIAVAHEAAIYELLWSEVGSRRFDRYLLRRYHYDSQEHILILELLPNAQDLSAHYVRSGRFSTTLAAAIGEALGTLHRLPGIDRRFAQPPPWVLSASHPELEVLREISSADLRLIQLIQETGELRQFLDELRQGWRAEALIHYDIKWDNWVVAPAARARPGSRLKLIDWELAGVGDPCWDIGSVFSNYLSFWLLSIPATGGAPPDRLMELARYPLEPMRPAIRACWQAYVRQMGLDAAADRWLLRAVRYAAARLIQTAFERTQTAAHLTANIICLLQLSLNILQRPQAAIVQLLGLPLQHSRAA
jgi:hypothetical protein